MITAMPRIAIAVHDFDAAVATFRDVFGMPVVDHSHRTVSALGAHVGMCVPEGGSNIELMAPSDPAAPLSQALQRFLDRRGEGPYALMLEAPDPDAEAVGLVERGLDVLPLMPGAGGRDVHPRSTHGVLVRVYPVDSAPPGDDRRSRPPGLSGVVRVVVATDDAELAATAWGRGFGLDVGPVVDDEERGVRSVECRPPQGGSIELVSTLDVTVPFGASVQRFVKEQHGGMYALVLAADDPHRAASQLAGDGVATTDATPPEVAVFGTRLVLV